MRNVRYWLYSFNISVVLNNCAKNTAVSYEAGT